MKTVHIVYGPPLAGKSTFVRENMGPDDLVFDMDAVQNALCYGADHAGKPHTGRRNRPAQRFYRIPQ